MPENEERHSRDPEVPESNKVLLVVAGLFLLAPLVGLMWVGSYAKEGPTLFGFPFFFWYQFLWVILCAACTYTAHRLVLLARKGGRGPARETSRESGATR